MTDAPATCRVCGCTDDDCRQCIRATDERCHWVEADLCSRCVPRERALKNLQKACAELRDAVNLVTVRHMETEYDQRLTERTDVVALALARVGKWLVRMAAGYERDGDFDGAELRILVQDFGNDDDETTMMDVSLEERVLRRELSGRVEGIGGPGFRPKPRRVEDGMLIDDRTVPVIVHPGTFLVECASCGARGEATAQTPPPGWRWADADLRRVALCEKCVGVL